MANRELATNRSGTFLKLPRVVAVEVLEDFNVRVTFSDGIEKVIDLAPYLRGPLSEPIRNDPAYFRTVHVDIDTIAWSNGLDIAPETLYYEGDPPWVASETKAGQSSAGRARRHAPKKNRRRKRQAVL